MSPLLPGCRLSFSKFPKIKVNPLVLGLIIRPPKNELSFLTAKVLPELSSQSPDKLIL